jgi:hypothetical protein
MFFNLTQLKGTVMSDHIDLYSEILADPIFTPALRDQITDVQTFQAQTEQFVDDVLAGVHTSAVLQGPPGLGKSYAVTQALKASGKREGTDYFVVKGHITPTQLFLVLYHYRRPGQVVVLDDCDDIYTKDTGLEVLKAATDNDYRRVTWNSNAVPVINGQPLTEYTFNGTIIVCTNMSMQTGRGGRRDRAAAAFMSRLTVWDLRLRTRERMYAQIFNMVVNADYLSRDKRTALTDEQKGDLLKFVLTHIDDIPCLDLRLPQKIAAEIVAKPKRWHANALHLVTHGG